MNFGISTLSLIPVRREPSEKSEMVTQILFGEHYEIMENMVGWSHVKLAFDNYEGWIDQKMVTPITQRSFSKIVGSPSAVSTDIFTIIPINNEQNLMIVAGSTLPVWRPYKKEFRIEKDVYPMPGNCYYGDLKNAREVVISQALKYFNAPYLWGGRSPFGIDCSGFTQVIFKTAGIKLPRDASEQVHRGTAFSFVEEAEPGDIAFFDNDEGEIIHTGIIWKRNKIIHASGKVRIDNVDQFGIFNVDAKRYTHKMRVMKKIL
ncbi:MAG: C40 family peptidase [Prolixibacteraceae bacterium]|nr:C40 family peptidase [Prolixibacteraceae bacterium]MBN2772664.1 C40 family peptidase [Prolixibacteraceae bacterium]